MLDKSCGINYVNGVNSESHITLCNIQCVNPSIFRGILANLINPIHRFYDTSMGVVFRTYFKSLWNMAGNPLAIPTLLLRGSEI